MNKKRLAWGALGLVLACVAALPAALAPARAADRPNIVLLMGDDHGWEETGYNGHAYLQTPVLDTMAASGLRLGPVLRGAPVLLSHARERADGAASRALRHVRPQLVPAPGGDHHRAPVARRRVRDRPLRQVARRRRQGRLAAQSRRDGLRRVAVARQLLRAAPDALAQRRAARAVRGRELGHRRRRGHPVHREVHGGRQAVSSRSSGSARPTSPTAGWRRTSPSTTSCRRSTRTGWSP